MKEDFVKTCDLEDKITSSKKISPHCEQGSYLGQINFSRKLLDTTNNLATKLYPPESFEEENKALNFGLGKFNFDSIRSPLSCWLLGEQGPSEPRGHGGG